jgi:hypothetical protein
VVNGLNAVQHGARAVGRANGRAGAEEPAGERSNRRVGAAVAPLVTRLPRAAVRPDNPQPFESECRNETEVGNAGETTQHTTQQERKELVKKCESSKAAPRVSVQGLPKQRSQPCM